MAANCAALSRSERGSKSNSISNRRFDFGDWGRGRGFENETESGAGIGLLGCGVLGFKDVKLLLQDKHF